MRLLCTAGWVSQAISVFVTLRLADILAHGPQTAAALARQSRVHPQALDRLLRLLAGYAIVVPREDQRYQLGDLGHTLRTDLPGAVGAYAEMMGRPWYLDACSHMLDSVRTGQDAWVVAHGQSVFDWLGAHPEDAQQFSEAMAAWFLPVYQMVAEQYADATIQHMVDIGGGHGALIQAFLDRHPQMQATLFDLPHVVDQAEQVLSPHDLTERVTRVGGSFLTDALPAGGDFYTLAFVSHNWTDDVVVTLLRACRAAMSPPARLAIIEMTLPDTPRPAIGQTLDMKMLVHCGSCERTADHLGQLLERAGLQMTRVIPLAVDYHIVEATHAEPS
jgi:hypothetical protein